jgi:CBS domain-containing membrane protein
MTSKRVSDLMTNVVYTLTPRDDMFAVQNVMDEHNIRHIPVVDEDQDLVGLITMRDLLRTRSPRDDDLPLEMREARMHDMRVSEVMTEGVATTEPDSNLHDAAQLMLENKFGCLPVVQGSRLAGILTEADFVRYFSEKGRG